MAGHSAVFGAVFVVFGAGLLLYGWRRRSYHRLITETPTTDIIQIDEPGLVELVGEVVSPDEAEGDVSTFEAPLSETPETVVAGWRVEEWSETGDRSRWKTLASGVDTVPFAIDDGTGHVVVDVGSHAERGGLLGRIRDAGELQDSVEVGDTTIDFRSLPTVREVGAQEDTPEEIRAFVENKPSLTRQTDSITNVVDIGNAHGDRRYREATISVGDEVYLLGPVRARDDDRATARLRPEEAVIKPAPDDETPFILSERSEDELVAATQSSKYALGFGAVLVLIGLGLVVLGIA